MLFLLQDGITNGAIYALLGQANREALLGMLAKIAKDF